MAGVGRDMCRPHRDTTRDMQRELREWRKEKAVKQRNDENNPSRSSASSSRSEHSLIWGQAQSSPKTPMKHRGHVNAISPLMEVCQNTGKSTSERKCYRATASPTDHVPPPFSASPSSVPAMAGTPTTCRFRMVNRGHAPEVVLAGGKSLLFDARGGEQPLYCEDCGKNCCEQDGRYGVGHHEDMFYCHRCWRSWQGTHDIYEDAQDPCSQEILAWQEGVQAPTVPPSTPATPFLGRLPGRRDLPDRLAFEGFFRSMPEYLEAVSQEDGSSLRRSLLPYLKDPEAELSNETPREVPPTPTAMPLPPCSPPPAVEREEQECTEAAPPVESLVEASSSLEPSLHERSDYEETAESQASEADDLQRFQEDVRRHETVWPPQTLLDMEDHLSRSHDIITFLFFEVRDRASSRTENDRPWMDRRLENIPEYPPSWSHWRIESSRSRSAMRASRRTISRHRSGTEASAPTPAAWAI